jgi:DNA-binding MarR family transcriptional regulator
MYTDYPPTDQLPSTVFPLPAPTQVASVPRTTPLHDMPGHLFRRLHQQGVALYGACAAGVDLTPVQYAALHAIAAWPGCDQSSIGRAIACDKTTLGAVLDRLQAKGLIERTADAADRRAWRLSATARGLELLERLAPCVESIQRELLAPLTPTEASQLMALLRRLVGPLPTPGASR